jgi:hypothetical protein
MFKFIRSKKLHKAKTKETKVVTAPGQIKSKKLMCLGGAHIMDE